MQKRKKVPYTVKGFLAWVAKQRGAYLYGDRRKCPNAKFHRAAGKVYDVADFWVIDRINKSTRLIDAVELLACEEPATYPALAKRAKAVRAWRSKPVVRRAA